MKSARLLRSGRIVAIAAGLIGLIDLLCLTGCDHATPVTADSDRARVALETALEAWKKGEPHESLKAANPPIHVSDSEWHDGYKLLEFELGTERSAGYGWRCEVQLTVEAKDGGKRKHLAVYRVDTDPAIVVVHEE